jgi:hypothetical protein
MSLAHGPSGGVGAGIALTTDALGAGVAEDASL